MTSIVLVAVIVYMMIIFCLAVANGFWSRMMFRVIPAIFVVYSAWALAEQFGMVISFAK